MKTTSLFLGMLLLLLECSGLQAASLRVGNRLIPCTQVLAQGNQRNSELYVQCQGCNGNMIPVRPESRGNGTIIFRPGVGSLSIGQEGHVLFRGTSMAGHVSAFAVPQGVTLRQITNFDQDISLQLLSPALQRIVDPLEQQELGDHAVPVAQTAFTQGSGSATQVDTVGAVASLRHRVVGGARQQAGRQQDRRGTPEARYHRGYVGGGLLLGAMTAGNLLVVMLKALEIAIIAGRLSRKQGQRMGERLESNKKNAWKTLRNCGIFGAVTGVGTALCWRKRLLVTA